MVDKFHMIDEDQYAVTFAGKLIGVCNDGDGAKKLCDEHSRLSQPIVETTLPGWDANGSPQR